MERTDFELYVSIEYENLPNFCYGCQAIGHSRANSKNINLQVPDGTILDDQNAAKEKKLSHRKTIAFYVIKGDINATRPTSIIDKRGQSAHLNDNDINKNEHHRRDAADDTKHNA